MANWIIKDIPKAEGHTEFCKCRGLGYVYTPNGICSCGTGEGCDLHSRFWMDRDTCDGKELHYGEETP